MLDYLTIVQLNMDMTTCLTGAETRLAMVPDVLGGVKSIRRLAPAGSLGTKRKLCYLP
jgi:hypothetical protein